MNNKLMNIYDKYYDESFNSIINKGVNREEAKSLMGLIFQKAGEALTKKDTTKESIEGVFNKTRMQFGVC
jgi:hypothetical protein